MTESMPVRIMMAIAVLTTFTALLAALLGAWPFSISSGRGATSEVEAHVLFFSGRPDPTWTITDPVREELPDFLVDLPPASPPDWPQFGCRGLQVLNLDPSLDLPPLVRVFQGVVEVGDSYFGDSRGLEAFLASTIPGDLQNDPVVNGCLPTVGGNAGVLGDSQAPREDASGSGGVGAAPVAAAVVGTVVALGAGGWYVRRRWSR